jgi:tRNA(adenine34) deaminase
MAAKSAKSKSAPAKRGGQNSGRRENDRRWSGKVNTVSTFPPENTFNKDAKSIARVMASKKVSPKGIGSGIRMIQFYINRAGKNLDAEQKQELEKAKHILQEQNREEKAKAKKKPSAKGKKQ